MGRRGPVPCRLTLKSCSALLSYPSAELKEAIPDIRAALIGEEALSIQRLAALEPLLVLLESADLLDLQADYGQLFDTSRRLALNLFEHVHGDSKDRGQAMLDLNQHYLDHGFLPVGNELPDYLPLFLEFASTLDPADARALLAEPASVLQALAERLTLRESPYAAVLEALVILAGATPDRTRITEMDRELAKDDGKTIDELWEETPVSFSSTPHDNPTGLIAKIRAFNRRKPVPQEQGHE